MSKTRQPINPFYTVLIVVGVAFCITACAYGLLVLKTTRVAVKGQDATVSSSGNSLMRWMDQYGMTIMGGELAILGLATAGAIWLDTHRAAREDQSNHNANS